MFLFQIPDLEYLSYIFRLQVTTFSNIQINSIQRNFVEYFPHLLVVKFPCTFHRFF
jgi:hypothetical protein